ncbi:MAG TPA: LamG-like jellyroll fold domain-containing protein, partial [Candidatus Dormibacteraeota bacterium]|nr:LamG-like jellyroll fold domain-containing protein [Candidatus Dormibacteraeota bacterium]
MLTTLATLLGTLTMIQPVAHASSPPGAPTGVSGVAVPTGGGGQITVSWTAPTSNGGAAITAYAIFWNPGSGELNTGGSGTSYTVTGLTNGTSYSFSVAAWNGIGWGPWSAASANVLACTYPGAPTNVTAVPASQQANVSWTAPASNGGSPITGYSVYVYPGGQQVGSSTTSAWVNGLTNGTAYTFTVIAANAAGWGAWSAYSPYVTPTADPYFSAVMNDHPGGYYRLDEPSGPTAYDSSGNGLNGTQSGNVFTPSAGGALKNVGDKATGFNRSGYITVPAGSAIEPGSTWTVEGWFNTPDVTTQEFILDKAHDYGLYVMNGHVYMRIGYAPNGGWNDFGGNTQVNPNTWYYVAASFDQATGTTDLYVNGGLDATSTGLNSAFTAGSPLVLGAESNEVTPIGSIPFKGTLDELGVYTTALPAAEINAHWVQSGNQMPKPSTTDPYAQAVLADKPGAYYRLDETSADGVEVVDAANHNDGIVSGPGYTQGVGGGPSGITDKATLFNGSGYTTVPPSASDDATTAWTVEGWFTTPDVTTQQFILDKAHDYGLYVMNGHVYMRVGYFNGTSTDFPSNTLLRPNTWYYIAATYNTSTQMRDLYINGGLDANAWVDGPQTGGSPLVLGAESNEVAPIGSMPFKGTLDELAVYTTALPAAEIKTHWVQSGNQIPKASTADPYAQAVLADKPGAYYRLDETNVDGVEIVDTAYHNDGIISGTTYQQGMNGGMTGIGDKATQFGGGAYVVVPPSPANEPTSKWSVEAWFNTPDVTTLQFLLDKGGDYGLYVNGGHVGMQWG